MPELPDVIVYREALERLCVGQRLARVDLKSPFLVRTFEPDLQGLAGQQLTGVERLGKRLVLRMEQGQLIVLHLMIAGRLHVRKPGARPKSKTDLAAFHFGGAGDQIEQTLFFTEASPKKRASIHVLADDSGLRAFDRGGLDVLSATPAEFRERLLCENHTLKRSLTDPRLFDGIGNAYSDEILHRARLSPLKWTTRLSADEADTLGAACREVMLEWIERLRAEAAEGFPEKVTAFRKEMAVHGRFGEPCPVCGAPVQRIRYADNETNYCAGCQTGGRLLADRSLSRLLKDDWPKSLDELEGP
ncbi:putative formamidopyrimidine-DNA glycosylase-like protein [Posidoniimonas corsicana]|uniref:Putative formamidopyrimidine-DNA glycosylase-like protein n=1 Tax=Posidoniimonas corsicana TaxID=1938618 RepID=A0A5C5VHI3_9BACT|nr:DNA-formamidopyrimidine glycosylase family protein [Posidoniimonas corsicana]TWT38036.1 putative formamidopyrimidine-DNA glycosylase-like protein [Posidoniimonas corsicana]